MQSMQLKHPGSLPPKKVKRVSSAGKVMASVFWDSQGVIMIDYLEQGRTINGACYVAELRRLRQEIARKRRGKLTRGVLLLQHNTPADTSQVAMTTADSKSFLIPHILRIWPLFSKLKSNLRGTQFGSDEGVIAANNEYLEDKKNDFYLEGISKLEQRWTKCIALKGNILKSGHKIFIPW